VGALVLNFSVQCNICVIVTDTVNTDLCQDTSHYVIGTLWTLCTDNGECYSAQMLDLPQTAHPGAHTQAAALVEPTAVVVLPRPQGVQESVELPVL
jgi:hypothetical protein